DKFALSPFLTSVEIFWPKEWNSTVFLAVDAGPKDEMLCSEIVGRAKCIVPEPVFRENTWSIRLSKAVDLQAAGTMSSCFNIIISRLT
ncbi:AG118, partial [Symbiodinium pilosum]